MKTSAHPRLSAASIAPPAPHPAEPLTRCLTGRQSKGGMVGILWIILIIVLVLVLLGGFGMRGRW